MSNRTIAGIIASALLALAALPGACADYPEIRTLTRDDLLYVQQQDELEQYYRLSKAPGSPQLPPLSIFRYRRAKAEDLFALNARLGMPSTSNRAYAVNRGKATRSAAVRSPASCAPIVSASSGPT